MEKLINIFSSALQGRTLESPLSVSDLYSSTLQCLQSNHSRPSMPLSVSDLYSLTLQCLQSLQCPCQSVTFTHRPSMPSKQPFKAFKALQSQSKLVCPIEHISGGKGGKVSAKLLILGFLLSQS